MGRKNIDNISEADFLNQIAILIRTNNLLLSRFILELNEVRNELKLPKRCIFFKFMILQEEYDQLVSEFGSTDVDKALYRLDRMLLNNKQDCPNNIAQYIRRKVRTSQDAKQSKRE